jgi:repressor LexA
MSTLGNKEVMAKNIQYYMDRKGIDRRKLSSDLDISYTTLTDWLKAKTYPRIDKIEMLANYFSIAKADLVEDQQPSTTLTLITETAAKLEEPRQKNVLTYAQAQLEEQEQGKILRPDFGSRDNAKKDVNVLGIMTAGRGTINDEKCAPIKTVRMYASDIPKHYDMAFEVKGHSMYPTFEDGEIIFVEKRTEVTNGMIGCVEINGDAFVKKMYVEEGKLRLVSLNNDYDNEGNRIYPDIYADEEDDIYIIGKVVN